jgi:hypothetical protein
MNPLRFWGISLKRDIIFTTSVIINVDSPNRHVVDIMRGDLFHLSATSGGG